MNNTRFPDAPVPRRIFAALVAAGLFTSSVAFAGPVVISQIYGAGGNSGATYRNDYVELFNAGNSTVSLNGWSVQYASATGTGNFAANAVVALPSTSLLPGQYFLVQQASGGTNGIALISADASGTQNMSGTAGKVVLVSSATGLGCNGGSTPCSTAQLAQIVDLVGFGNANFAEGSAATAPSAATAIFRKAGGCIDSNTNSADFETGAPAPRNSASPLSACGGVAINQPIVASCPALVADQGIGGSVAISASDADSTVNGIVANGSLPPGITLDSITPAAGEGGSATASVSVAASVATGNYSVPVLFNNDEAQSATCTVAVTVQPAAAVTRIYDIQGDGSASPLVNQTVTTEGIVSAVFPNLGGYYLQDESGDGNVTTSDGIFVYAPGNSVTVGQKLRLTATVAEFSTVTELTGPTNVQVLGSSFTVAPTDIVLPETVEGELERYEGMLVRIVTPLTVSQNYFLGRYGQVTLAADGRMEIPTNHFAPGSPEAFAQADGNARRRIVLDDGSSAQNPNPIPYIGADNTLRAGDTVHDLTGIIDHGLITSSGTGQRDYKLHPTAIPVFSRDNTRTAAPASVGGSIKVASFNVLNYFTTFTDGKTSDGQSGQGCTLGGATSAANCRGADNASEFARQQAKIVAAIKAVNADVVGLMEIQNNGVVAVQNLANALNAAYGSNIYAAITNLSGSTGSDAIRVAMI
ncbi:MAG: ExeM/NucH family extracellular endonuclease [Propionivibrio sp.]|uniref:ExeM/NucH family extracellular endonuclease n=1 Tax=Propionivibrio sp. TaxID=2212460 RepID=UPI001A47ADD5|nr:ExeM/NucH family extracellular endonuclease [Propionivibrio sp.]MBL8415641.1 ExeM/NucH family extracellular endonuclease [Propionivibrio sp.]